MPLALLDEKTGAVYLPIASDHKNQNERLMPFIEKRVKVTGTVVTKGGMTGIVIKTLAPVPAICDALADRPAGFAGLPCHAGFGDGRHPAVDHSGRGTALALALVRNPAQ